MDAFVEKTLAFLEHCDGYSNLPDLVTAFSRTLAAFGFNYFMMTRLPAIGEDAEAYVIAHSWPKEWLDRYRSEGFFWHDPVSIFSMTQGRAFTWTEARNGSKRTRTALRIASEAKSIDLVDGIGFPMGDPSSVQAVVSLASDQPVDLGPMQRQLLKIVCEAAEARSVELYDSQKNPFGRLTERQREVLRWIANGKDQWETSRILDISPETVKEHLAAAREKLRASSNPHAVALALRDRQLIL
jgi:LuxR family quorum sensing-dependent transcriptional regulator